MRKLYTFVVSSLNSIYKNMHKCFNSETDVSANSIVFIRTQVMMGSKMESDVNYKEWVFLPVRFKML